MKLFDKMKTNEREMILSMLANNAERNIELLVEQTFDVDCQFTFTDVLDLADYFDKRWGTGMSFYGRCMDINRKRGQEVKE